MKFYLAPLEGITGHIFRNAVYDMFGEGIDKYFTPFLMPHIKIPMSAKGIKEINPDNNVPKGLVPQILTNDAEGFTFLEKAIREYGHEEINLNLGCPSKTVVSKGRGSGFLRYPDKLDDFLYSIYENATGPISIKTRLGDCDADEISELIAIYNKYPVHELTIHARVRAQGYGGKPDIEGFGKALALSKAPVCYNGDIYTKADYDSLIGKLAGNTDQPASDISAVMIGRGMIANPALIRELTTGQPTTNDDLNAFMTRIRDDYARELSGDTHVLFKLKEIWAYMARNFPEKEKLIKKMQKSKTIREFEMYEWEILS